MFERRYVRWPDHIRRQYIPVIWSRNVVRDSIDTGHDPSLGVAPNRSKLFMAGSGFSAEGDFDFTTVAYAM